MNFRRGLRARALAASLTLFASADAAHAAGGYFLLG